MDQDTIRRQEAVQLVLNHARGVERRDLQRQLQEVQHQLSVLEARERVLLKKLRAFDAETSEVSDANR